MKKILKIILSPVLGKKFFQPLFWLLFRIGLKGMNIGGGSTYSESGEAWVVEFLSLKKKQFVLFDVGANVGNYARMACIILSNTTQNYFIHCFEPARVTFAHLEKNLTENSRVVLNNQGVGDAEGSLVLHSDGENSGLASLYNRDLGSHFLSQTEQVSITTIDTYCKQKKIDHIDLLKLDIEGYEFNALKGASEMIARGLVCAIQFEFGGTSIDARVYLRDFFRLLEDRYRIYRILQNGLWELSSYSEYDELFVTTNFLALIK